MTSAAAFVEKASFVEMLGNKQRTRFLENRNVRFLLSGDEA